MEDPELKAASRKRIKFFVAMGIFVFCFSLFVGLIHNHLKIMERGAIVPERFLDLPENAQWFYAMKYFQRDLQNSLIVIIISGTAAFSSLFIYFSDVPKEKGRNQ